MLKTYCWLLFWIVVVPLWGLNPQKSLTQFVHTAWTEKTGAPGAIHALAQTVDGFLWLGTPAGLYRFDGVQFTRFEPPRNEEFPGTSIRKLCATTDGSLWVVFRSGRVSRLLQGRVKTYGANDNLPYTWSLAEGRDGTLWAGTDSGLRRFEGGNWTEAGKRWNFPVKPAKLLFFDRSGALWVATDDSILFLPSGRDHFERGGAIGFVSTFTQSPDGAIWIADTNRTVHAVALTGKSDRIILKEIRVQATSALFDQQGSLWIGVAGDGLRRIAEPERVRVHQIAPAGVGAERFSAEDGLSGDYVISVLEDREGTIWYGTFRGLDRFRDGKFTPVTIRDGDQPLAIAASGDGSLWVGSDSRGALQRIAGDTAPTILPQNVTGTYALYEDQTGTVYGSTPNGVGRLTDHRFTYLRIRGGTQLHSVWGITGDRSGGLWLLDSERGVFRLFNEELISFGQSSALKSAVCAHGDQRGWVWFGRRDGKVVVYRNSQFQTFGPTDGLPEEQIWTIAGDRQDRVWVGGEGGLSEFSNGRFRSLTGQSGLPVRIVGGIVADQDGFLWLATEIGAVLIDPRDFDRAATDPGYHLPYTSYNLLDGIPGNVQFAGLPFPKVAQTADGRIWFAATNGLAYVDPRRSIPKNKLPPPVHIEAVKVDRKQINPVQDFVLARHTHDIEIDYTALSLSVPERVLFRYKLEGADTDWQEAGMRRQAFYNNLGPKQYRFRVIACNNDGIWNDAGASWNFSVAPDFYETGWFRVFCAAIGASLIWTVYRMRLRQITIKVNLRHEERLAERTRIARELHDTLLQSFQGLMLRFQTVADLLPRRPEEARQVLEATLERADEAIAEGRDAVQDLRSSTAVINDLGQSLRSFGQDLSTGNSAEFRMTVAGSPRDLHPILRDEIYRIGREALQNAFRHAKASHVETEITYELKLFRLRIRDDGRGIEPQTLDTGERRGHWGLPGMRERAERIGARLDIWSRLSAGTEIDLCVPGSVAYGTAPGRDGWWRSRKKASKA
jgi:signal transduction histidine kinase/ligand-binding sensor domain-containing protein